MSEIRNRIEKNNRKLEAWAKKFQIEAYRIYERDIPEYPFIVDRYKDQFVIYDRGNEFIDGKEEKKGHFPELLAAIQDIFKVPEKNLIIKRRARQKGESQYEKVGATGETTLVREGQAVFIVNLYDYLDTGLFLDHRLMRQKIFETVKGKDFLNLFAYTGSVSVFAALGGARTTSVDMSATYSRWSQDNFTANNIPLQGHQFVTENALEFLANPPLNKKYDVIFLDPPTFSNSKKMDETFEVERDQEFLVRSCMNILKEDGVLYFSNNKRTFKLSPTILEKCRVKDITAQTIPKDFRDPKVHYVFEIRRKV